MFVKNKTHANNYTEVDKTKPFRLESLTHGKNKKAKNNCSYETKHLRMDQVKFVEDSLLKI